MEGEEGGFQEVRRRKKLVLRDETCSRMQAEALQGEALFAANSLESIIDFYARRDFLAQNQQGLWEFASPYWSQVLHAAISHDRMDVLDFFLRAGASPFQPERNTGRLPHHLACVKGNLLALEKLLEYLTIGNTDFLQNDPKDGRGFNSLLLATEACQLNIVTFLIQQGSKVNSRCNHGRNALHIITSMKDSEIKKSDKMLGIPLDICRLLIKKGISIDHADKTGLTPVMIATQQGNQAMLRLLVTHGADVDREAPNLHTPSWKHRLSVREHIASRLGSQSTLSRAIDYGVNGRLKMDRLKEVQMIVRVALESVLSDNDVSNLIFQFCKDDLGESKTEEEDDEKKEVCAAAQPKKKKKKKTQAAVLLSLPSHQPVALKNYNCNGLFQLIKVAVVLTSVYLIGEAFL